jgi:hypothetical protein
MKSLHDSKDAIEWLSMLPGSNYLPSCQRETGISIAISLNVLKVASLGKIPAGTVPGRRWHRDSLCPIPTAHVCEQRWRHHPAPDLGRLCGVGSDARLAAD